ncbi:MAG: type II toxin-antitoxin system Phd/YefM family antitoxin [Anaeroplasmataceae bacterium]|nr:type II toxin-antitoxin system Phd/YefM family antitoxin [Anaeroplasmataceae bacterium]
MPQIIPIKDLRDTNKISELCSTSNEPIFVTKNGYGDMVVMSMKTYEEKLARIEMYESILAGIENAKKERLHDGRLTLAELKAKYGE